MSGPITIPCGLMILDREIDLLIEFCPDYESAHIYSGDQNTATALRVEPIGKIKLTVKLRDALEAAAREEAQANEEADHTVFSLHD